MKVIVNDANILIDLVELELLKQFFALDFEFLTTALILDELADEQQRVLYEFIEHELLLVKEFSSSQIIEINTIQKSKPSLSQQDCSAFYQAQTENGILVTSDNTLRKFALENALEVHGHLWVFDKMVEHGSISGSFAINKLEELCNTINQKLGLPEDECQKRINHWKTI